VFALAAGGTGFCGGAEGGEVGVSGAGAHLAELVADPRGRPGGFDGVGVAHVDQQPVRHAPHVGPVHGAEGGDGLVPGGSQVR
jgi:hypothetical protein